MRYYRKSLTPGVNIITDITKAFNILSSNKKDLYHITITDLPVKHAKDLNFLLTNKLLNTIRKDYLNTFEFINYLFVIEYGGIISKGDSDQIDTLGEHAHLIVHTSLCKQHIEFYLNTCFSKIVDSRIDDIGKSVEKEGLLKYLLKQDKLLTGDNYNYKISQSI